VAADGDDQRDGVRDDEEPEDRRDGRHALLHAAEVHQRQEREAGEGEGELVGDERGEKAEDGVGARGDRDGDRQDVVDEERGAGDDADARPEDLAGDDVAAAARGELLDDPAVAVADDEDGERRRGGEEDGEPGVEPAVVVDERAEGFVGAVRARREPVGAEADPGEERDERELVKGVRIFDVLRRADDDVTQTIHERGHVCLQAPAGLADGLGLWSARAWRQNARHVFAPSTRLEKACRPTVEWGSRGPSSGKCGLGPPLAGYSGHSACGRT
jgi:hypothetical protein